MISLQQIDAHVREMVADFGVTRFSAGRISRAIDVSEEDVIHYFCTDTGMHNFNSKEVYFCGECSQSLSKDEEGRFYCVACGKYPDSIEPLTYFDLINEDKFLDGKS